jgi:hypothetical protein
MNPFQKLIREQIASTEGLTENDFQGATEDEIRALERTLGVQRLPGQYRAFLQSMGWEPGQAAIGEDVRFGCIGEINLEMREFDAETKIGIPDDAIAILAHQGYEYHFIRAAEGEDPPVHMAREDTGISLRYESVSKWVVGLFYGV